MIDRCIARARRVFPERQFLLRSGEKVRHLSLPGWLQAAALLGAFALVGGIGGLAGAYHNLHKAIHRKEAEISVAVNRAEALTSLRDALARTDAHYVQLSGQLDDVKQQLRS